MQRKVAELQRDLTKQIRYTKESTARLSKQLDNIKRANRGGGMHAISEEEHSDSGSSYGGSVH
eukprot:COSAG02_NODE_9243_length_2279_cov_1.732569_2_plen_63_part_00